MRMTGHKARSVFDRYDITSEEDLAEASRKLAELTGTIAGRKALSDAQASKEALAKSVDGSTSPVVRVAQHVLARPLHERHLGDERDFTQRNAGMSVAAIPVPQWLRPVLFGGQ